MKNHVVHYKKLENEPGNTTDDDNDADEVIKIQIFSSSSL